MRGANRLSELLRLKVDADDINNNGKSEKTNVSKDVQPDESENLEYLDQDYSEEESPPKKQRRNGVQTISMTDTTVMALDFPKEYNESFVTAIFEIGLRNASPKVLMKFMPYFPCLSAEHIKSHLQKYRMRSDRSRDEFLSFYYDHINDHFEQFQKFRGWEKVKDEQHMTASNLKFDNYNQLKDQLDISNASKAFSDWCLLFQTIMIEHARIQHLMRITIEEFDVDDDPKFSALLGKTLPLLTGSSLPNYYQNNSVVKQEENSVDQRNIPNIDYEDVKQVNEGLTLLQQLGTAGMTGINNNHEFDERRIRTYSSGLLYDHQSLTPRQFSSITTEEGISQGYDQSILSRYKSPQAENNYCSTSQAEDVLGFRELNQLTPRTHSNSIVSQYDTPLE